MTIFGWLYIAVGVLGLGCHFRELLAMQKDSVWVETTELVAIVCAVFLLRGQNWARWVAVAWAAFHVLISVLNVITEWWRHSVEAARGIRMAAVSGEERGVFSGRRVEDVPLVFPRWVCADWVPGSQWVGLVAFPRLNCETWGTRCLWQLRLWKAKEDDGNRGCRPRVVNRSSYL